MTYRNKQLRPGATAIAAALALSTTPLFAQDLGSQPVVTLPTPAPPVAAPAPTLPTPAAPVATRTVAPEPVATTVERSAEPQAAATTTRRTSTTTAIRSRPTVRATEPAAAAPAPVAQAEPIAPAPIAPLAETAPAPLAEPVATPAEPVVAESGDGLLPIVGGAAGLLVLAGGAYALSRRRRTEDEGYAAEMWEQDHVAYAEPVTAEPDVPAWSEPAPVASPAPAMAAAAIPAGMDLSRHGRHVQAAYAGPTPDNPSLSLKRRLKRAAFFDQRERMAREAGEPSDMVQPVATPQVAPVRATQGDQLVTSRRVSAKTGTQALFGFRPTFQN